MLTATAPSADNPQPPPSAPTSAMRPNANHHPHGRTSNGRRSISSTQPLNPQLNGAAASGGPIPTPVPPKQPHGGAGLGPAGMPPFDGSRSPPGSKNLKHVPCKFFRQGACQAGKACPFSHDTDPATETAPCKYFSKGNCKFGQKCALAHILPNGQRVNRGHANGHLQFGRMDPHFTNHRSALHNSLMQANVGNVGHHTPNHSLGGQEDFPPLGQPIPQIDQTLSSSLPDSQFGGSPRNQDGFQMATLGTSNRTLGPLDATLPASIDRYDYSYFAKHGPFASSVPNTFGVESPPPSLPNSIRGESTVTALRKSAFGDDENGVVGELSRSIQARDASFSERILHSSSTRRPKVYSSSYAGPAMMGGLGSLSGLNGLKDDKAADFSDADFAFEEDFVPESLSDLLTPAERNRRMSRTDEEGAAVFRNSLANSGAPGDTFGSPPVGSPGSWGPIINRHKRDEDTTHMSSSVGHVGSPLRNSYLQSDSGPAIRSLNCPSGDISPFTSSPAVRGTGAGISALTQSLKLTSLNESEAPGAVKTSVGKPLERAISSPRLGSGKAVHSIDEEAECQFNLEVEEDGPARQVGGFNATNTSSTAGRPAGLGLGEGFFTGRP